MTRVALGSNLRRDDRLADVAAGHRAMLARGRSGATLQVADVEDELRECRRQMAKP